MCFFSFVAGCSLIAGGTFLVIYRNKFDNVKAQEYSDVYRPVGPLALLTPGILLIVAGALLLVRFLGYFSGFEQRRGCCSGFSKSIRTELFRMVYGPGTDTGTSSRAARRRRGDGEIARRRQRLPLSWSDSAGYSDRRGLDDGHYGRDSRLYRAPRHSKFWYESDERGRRERRRRRHDLRPDYCRKRDLGGEYAGAILHHHEYEYNASSNSYGYDDDDTRSTISRGHYGKRKEHVHLRETGTERVHRRDHRDWERQRRRGRHREKRGRRKSGRRQFERWKGKEDYGRGRGYDNTDKRSLATLSSISSTSLSSYSSDEKRRRHQKARRYAWNMKHPPRPKLFYPEKDAKKDDEKPPKDKGGKKNTSDSTGKENGKKKKADKKKKPKKDTTDTSTNKEAAPPIVDIPVEDAPETAPAASEDVSKTAPARAKDALQTAPAAAEDASKVPLVPAEDASKTKPALAEDASKPASAEITPEAAAGSKSDMTSKKSAVEEQSPFGDEEKNMTEETTAMAKTSSKSTNEVGPHPPGLKEDICEGHRKPLGWEKESEPPSELALPKRDVRNAEAEGAPPGGDETELLGVPPPPPPAEEEDDRREAALSPSPQGLMTDAQAVSIGRGGASRRVGQPLVSTRRQGGVQITERVRVVEDVTIVDLAPLR